MSDPKCHYIKPNGKLCRNPMDFKIGKLNSCEEHYIKLSEDETAIRRSELALWKRKHNLDNANLKGESK